MGSQTREVSSLFSDHSIMFNGEYPEDANAQVKEVVATRRNGKRYNSAAGFIFHYQKSRCVYFYIYIWSWLYTQIVLNLFWLQRPWRSLPLQKQEARRGWLAQLRKSITDGAWDESSHNHPPEIDMQRRLDAVNRMCKSLLDAKLQETSSIASSESMFFTCI